MACAKGVSLDPPHISSNNPNTRTHHARITGHDEDVLTVPPRSATGYPLFAVMFELDAHFDLDMLLSGSVCVFASSCVSGAVLVDLRPDDVHHLLRVSLGLDWFAVFVAP